jgi:hypothetical protein
MSALQVNQEFVNRGILTHGWLGLLKMKVELWGIVRIEAHFYCHTHVRTILTWRNKIQGRFIGAMRHRQERIDEIVHHQIRKPVAKDVDRVPIVYEKIQASKYPASGRSIRYEFQRAVTSGSEDAEIDFQLSALDGGFSYLERLPQEVRYGGILTGHSESRFLRG